MTPHDAQNATPGSAELTRFFVPLALIAISQALTYPLVAMVASRGPGGALNMAGLAQSNTFMFFLSSISAGLVTTGMTYGRTRGGYQRYLRANTILMVLVGTLHALFSLPGPSHLVFGVIMGLAPAIEQPARLTFMACLPLHMLFFLRNAPHVALFNAHRTARAYVATLGRIVVTAALSPVFCAFGLVGPVWAVVCLTVPLLFEIVAATALARPYVRALEDETEPVASMGEVLRFTFTLSVGTVFLSLSGYVAGAFVARAPNPEHVLPATYLALGLVSPVSFAASRIQALVVAFSANRATNRQLARYAGMTGLFLGALPLLFLTPGLRQLYYVRLQNLPPADLHLATAAALALFFTPVTVALRSYGEGRAAFVKKPEAVLCGQAAYLGLVVTTAFVALQMGLPGQYIIPLSVGVGNLCAVGTLMMVLGGLYREGMPPAPSHAVFTEN